MKTKLTLTIDRGISHRAKSLARQRGSSLSELIEELLADQMGTDAQTPNRESFSKRWAGRMELSARNDARARKLRKKYHIEKRK